MQTCEGKGLGNFVQVLCLGADKRLGLSKQRCQNQTLPRVFLSFRRSARPSLHYLVINLQSVYTHCRKPSPTSHTARRQSGGHEYGLPSWGLGAS